jgi:aminopeptidase N
LVIYPTRSIHVGDPMHVVVRYQGIPQTVIDPDGSVDGWIPVDDGAIALCEPQGAPSWFPVNDYPTDKATFDVRVTVPGGYRVMGNGTPSPPVAMPGARTTFEWAEDNPMAPYLTTIAIGPFVTTSGQTPNGVPVYTGVDPREVDAAAPALAQLGTMVDWLTSLFGPYPFDTVGAIVDRAPQVGYALETQTRPTFTSAPGPFTLVHELAHQWFGDSVSLAQWPEMWLNEGFATYVEWLWSEHEGLDTARQQFIDTYQSIPASSQFWTIPPAALPDPTQLFGGAVYERGAMTLGALRETIGDADFFTILQTWANTHKYGNVSTAEFETLAEAVSGMDLTAFFDAWLLQPSKPPHP